MPSNSCSHASVSIEPSGLAYRREPGGPEYARIVPEERRMLVEELSDAGLWIAGHGVSPSPCAPSFQLIIRPRSRQEAQPVVDEAGRGKQVVQLDAHGRRLGTQPRRSRLTRGIQRRSHREAFPAQVEVGQVVAPRSDRARTHDETERAESGDGKRRTVHGTTHWVRGSLSGQ
jgi:hypothetical protein